ncbi:MAG: LrgB family protein, partial [Prevotella sp.]|nr:LrgB family protein [Prevotella sp.]
MHSGSGSPAPASACPPRHSTTAPLSWFLTPATVSLTIPLYQQLDRLKKNIKAILI